MNARTGCIGLALAMVVIQPSALAQQAAPAVEPSRGEASALPILLSETELRTTRGGQTLIINNQSLKAITSGNTIGDYVAGDISFTDNAFANFSGIGNFTINTGAQNNLQTAMILTVNISD